MEKRLILSAVTTVLLMIFLFGVFFFAFAGGTVSSAASPQPAYILREYQGKLAVFLPGFDTPEQVTDQPVSLLPDWDQAELRAGVPVTDEEALSRALEDYTS